MKHSVREPLRGVRLVLLDRDADLRVATADVLARKGCVVRDVGDVETLLAEIESAPADAVVVRVHDEDPTALVARVPESMRVLVLARSATSARSPNVRVLQAPMDVEVLLEAIATTVERSGTSPCSLRPGQPLRLALYLDSRSAAGARARRRFYDTLARFSPEGAAVIEVDVRAGAPPEGVPMPALLPAVCLLEPGPNLWLVGDLADVEPLEALLERFGVARLAQTR